MDVAPPMDFDFSSSLNSSAYYYGSAPTSPTRLTELYCGFDELLISASAHRTSSPATVPFAWEDKPGVPKPFNNLSEDDFEFDVSCRFGSDSVWAEDLFDGGVIKTVEPPSPMQQKNQPTERGRERRSSGLPSSRSRRTRSLSPLGGSDYRREQQGPMAKNNTMSPSASICSTPSASSSENGSRKWSFKDLFLFRSASDGRAMDRDPFKKFSAIFRKHDEDFRNSCESGSTLKRRGRVSAHELHYAVNRAASKDMKKKTFLPYKQGILG